MRYVKWCAAVLLWMIVHVAFAESIYTEKQLTIPVSMQRPLFTLKLNANPTTGYQWSASHYDKRVLMLVKHSFQPAANNLIGAGGFELWTFQVNTAAFKKPQVIPLHMVYARPWKNADPVTEVRFKVVVKRK